MTQQIRTFLVDDHPLMRKGLRLVIEDQPDMQVVGEAGDRASALAQIEQLQPDIVLMDIRLPNGSGVQATEEIKRLAPNIQVLMLTQNDDLHSLRQSLAAGASGYVLKLSGIDTLLVAIRAAMTGSLYFDPKVRELVTHSLQHRAKPQAAPSSPALSEREQEVLRQLALGYSHKEIAAALDISPKTVETYRQRACEKLGLQGRTAILRHAVQQGWLEDA